MIVKTQRARSVRPQRDVTLQPIHMGEAASDDGDTGEAKGGDEVVPMGEPLRDQDGEWEVIDTDTRPVWEKMQEKIKRLSEKVAIHFEDRNENESRKQPIVKAPLQPTKEEIEQHQTTHIPYAPWCKHCVAARAVRRQHPHKGGGAMIVPDVDCDTNEPMKVSLDYMYLHERTGKQET